MVVVQLHKLWVAGLAGAVIAAGPGMAGASVVASGAPSPYVFPDGSQGFALQTHGGVLNPGVLVGFNPQPDPPGTPPTAVGFANPNVAVFSNSTGGAYQLELALTGLGSGMLTLPAAPNTDGRTSSTTTIDGHVFTVSLAFGPGPVTPGSWGAFNPQPDPPGDFTGVGFQFAGDPWMDLSLTEDQRMLTLGAAPEPATWAMLILGVAMIGFAARRRRNEQRLAV